MSTLPGPYIPAPVRRLARDPVGTIRRGWSGGSSTMLRLAMGVPAPVRRPLSRSLAAAGDRALAHRPGLARVPVLTVIAGRAAGPADEAAARARRLGTSPRTAPGDRRRLAAVAFAAGFHAVAAAIASSIADDRSPTLEIVRAELALEGGRYAESLAHAERARAAGSRAAQSLVDEAGGQLTVLEPGWLPDVGPGAARLATLRGRTVRGRVLHVVSVALPHRLAGYTVRTQAVAACQVAAGLDAEVLTRLGFPRMGGTGGPGIDVVGGIRYHRVPPGVDAKGPVRVLEDVVRAAVPLLEELRPAAIQPASNYVQAKIGLALGRELGVPVVYEVRGFWEESWAAHREHDEATAMETDRYRLAREAETATMLAADAVVTLSETMRSAIVERGRDPEGVVVVPNAVDVERFQPLPRQDALGASLGIEPADRVVGYVTTLNAYEGIVYLLEAVAQLRDRVPRLRILLVGDGDDRDVIQGAARRLGLDDGTLVMPGRVPHAQILGYYSLIDVFVVPRTANRVSRLVTPLKPYEAMALERAVVVSDLPALREIVTPGETGLTFRAEDAVDLARVLGELLDDPAQRTRLGRQAREWIVANRTWAANGRRYRELFERLGAA